MYGRPSRPLFSRRPGTFIARNYAVSVKNPQPRRVSKAESKEATKLMNTMVDQAAHDLRTYNETDKNRMTKLGNVLRKGQSSKFKGEWSVERATFDFHSEQERTVAGVAGEENEAPDIVYEPGTFVELRKSSATVIGVILGSQYSARSHEYVTLTSTGIVWEHTKDNVMFEVPNLVESDLISRCGMESAPANDSQHHARVEVLKRLRQLEIAVHEASHGITMLPSALYDIVKSPDPTKSAVIGAAEVTRLLFKKPAMVKVYAVHKFLMTNSLYFVAAYDYPVSKTFSVRPQEVVDRIRTIDAWVKLPDGPIHRFAEKAKQVRAANKKLVEENRDREPERRVASHVWTEDDRTILLHLLDKLRFLLGCQSDPLMLGSIFIFHKVVADDFRDERLQALLIDLGVLAPWGDLTPLAAGLLDGGKRERREAKLVKRSFASRGSQSQVEPLGPEDFYPADPLDSVRHDFGNLPVYVIDDPDASELDDGISIEPVPNEPGTYWVHAHIANPTSILPPTHYLAHNPEGMHNSLYLQHKTYAMLPRKLTHHPEYPLSLISSESPQKVLTFSTKVSSNGDITDYTVRAGIIRNVILRSYESVNLAMGWERVRYTYPFGGGATPAIPAELGGEDVKNLQRLAEVVHNLRQRRWNEGAFQHSHPTASLYDVRWPPGTDRYFLDPTCHLGFPKMGYRVTSSKDQDVGAHAVVSEVMKLGCSTASLFCRDRNIPILRRYATSPIVASESAYQELLDSRTPNGYIDYWRSYSALALDSVGGHSLEPRGHFGLAVKEGDGYARVTSPLRRHSDLVTHWQIQSALLGKRPVYDTEWMEGYKVQVQGRTRLLTRLEGVQDTYYNILFLKRWTEDRERGKYSDVADPFEDLKIHTGSWPVLNLGTRTWSTEGDIPTLGLKAIVTNVDNSLPPGVEIPVTLKEFALGLRSKIHVVPK
ncbi:RNB-domain-containing protein [Marasmius fiardii PR-910]|nr:RNB-domain-containing protein [Marasmius fiardii PR-910]